MSIPIWSMSAMRCSADIPCRCVRLAILAVDLLARRAGLGFEIPPRDLAVVFDHRRRLVASDMAMDVDREPLAAGMRRAREPPRNPRARRPAGEQHRRAPRPKVSKARQSRVLRFR